MGFFGLSGFLIASSRARTARLPFLRNRALRILPGYWMAIALTAFAIAPLASALQGASLPPGGPMAYLTAHLPFNLAGSDEGIQAAFGDRHVNGSLWTLAPEVLCYLLLLLIPARMLRPVAVAEATLLIAFWIAWPPARQPTTSLLLAFVVGALAWSVRDRVTLSGARIAASWVVVLPAFLLGLAPLGVVALVVGTLGLAWLPLRWTRDLSYGTYVLAYPTQSLLAIVGVTSFGLLAMIGASVAVVLVLALASWTLIERPALRLRHIRLPRTDHTEITTLAVELLPDGRRAASERERQARVGAPGSPVGTVSSTHHD
jgi:peptidoglycan/LPS O-acetylase OafA/YrhL